MTTCTWDEKRLSADTRSMTGDVIDQGPCQKIFQRKGVFCAVAGDLAEAIPVVRYLLKPKGKRPKIGKGDFQILLVSASRAEYYDGEYIALPVTGPFAIGTGGDHALAAMLCGKSGPQAIRIAAQMDPHTGVDFGVRTFKIR